MIKAEIQKLEPGALIRLFELDATSLGGDVSRFHAHNHGGPIIWRGLTFHQWPVEADGFVRDGERVSNPTLRVGNVNGSITTLCQFYDDLIGARLTCMSTLGKFLDAVNFPEGNPDADPDEAFPPEVYYIERKTNETNVVVEFELASALDFQGVQLPGRQIFATVCGWGYRSSECGYAGPPVARRDDTPTAVMAEDRCSKRLSGCELRFGSGNPLPFGAFPAADLVRG